MWLCIMCEIDKHIQYAFTQVVVWIIEKHRALRHKNTGVKTLLWGGCFGIYNPRYLHYHFLNVPPSWKTNKKNSLNRILLNAFLCYFFTLMPPYLQAWVSIMYSICRSSVYSKNFFLSQDKPQFHHLSNGNTNEYEDKSVKRIKKPQEEKSPRHTSDPYTTISFLIFLLFPLLPSMPQTP